MLQSSHLLQVTPRESVKFQISFVWIYSFLIIIISIKVKMQLRLEKLFCFSLKTGGLLIAILELIFSIVIIITITTLLQTDYELFMDHFFKQSQSAGGLPSFLSLVITNKQLMLDTKWCMWNGNIKWFLIDMKWVLNEFFSGCFAHGWLPVHFFSGSSGIRFSTSRNL